MTTELMTLLAAAALCLALPMIYGPLYSRQVSLMALAGNREGLPPATGAAGRGQRAHANLVENLVPYAAVVLVAHVLGVHNGITAAAAIVFLVARLAHAVCYLLGIVGLRTLAYYAGLVATLVIGAQILLR